MKNRLELLRIVAGKFVNPVVAEVGVFRGSFSSDIYRILEPTELHLIDPWRLYPESEFADYTYLDQKKWDRIHDNVVAGVGSLSGVSIVRQESIPAADLYPDGYFDFVYIDANHKYEHVLQDLRAWLPKVKSGGFISGHDIDQKQVKKAVIEVIGTLDIRVTNDSLKSYLAQVP